ncbi:MAG: peptide chain release factor N(5)-glutamine methyltransferase [Bacteroidales bacterium]|nr:peptide chain release factor N(5)-glutamine methyltransferase [Bacteroidales bacterium]
MQKALSYIKKELSCYYPEMEIKSFSYLILQYVCKKDKHALLLDKDNQLSLNENSQIKEIVADLKKFRPIQHILGKSEFYGSSYIVNENVLIPRPETEELVDLILTTTHHPSPDILDIGTGSGCIAVSLAKNLPEANVYGMDISDKALRTASQNALINQVKVSFFQENILELSESSLLTTNQWDIIVSNPPYIVPAEKKYMSENVLKYEPHYALFVPEDQPLLFYEKIADVGLRHLSKEGKLFFETSSLYGKATADMLINKGYKQVELYKDISGNDRIIQASIL